MYYAMTKFSFDPAKNVFGPFKTEDEAWNYIEKMADEQYRIDTEECGWEAYLRKDKDSLEIILEDVFGDRSEIMEFFVFGMK